MKQLIVASMLAAGVICGSMAVADESGTANETHHYVKNSVITTKVKSKLAAKHLTSLTKIKVDTDENGVVWLSGHAPNQDAVDMAGMLAKDTDGVTSVHNDVKVKQ